jgi:hypothetical protein
VQFIFKWNGQYAGFISDGYVFDPSARYLGWVEESGHVYGIHGRYVGELVDQNYIMRNLRKTPQLPKPPITAIIHPKAPVPPLARPPRDPVDGLIDASF